MRRVNRYRLRRAVFCTIVLLCLPLIAFAQSWNWRYDFATDTGIWSWGTVDRFKYEYAATSLQWWDYTTFGGWQKLGAQGASPVSRQLGADLTHFIGNGTWRDLLTGWQYLYDTSYNGCSLWRDNTDPLRFSYCYGTGQWNDFSWYSSGYWSGLGTQGLSQKFIGDGNWYALGNGWEYEYVTSPTIGCSLWRDNTAPIRFSYCYNTGQWNDFSFYTPGYWSGIGLGSMSSVFIGDTNWHDLGNGWAYSYTAVSNMGVSLWRDNTAPIRFSYCYNTGQWNDFSFYTPGHWSGIGSGSMSSAFIGDGEWHELGTGWSFRYRSWFNGYAVWKDADGMQFSYGYLHGMWNDYSPATSTWAGLGSGGLSSVFIGNGQWHGLGTINGADWRYAYAEDSGTWQQLIGTTYTDRFQYNYNAGQWWDYGYDGVRHELGVAGLSNSFVGDGNPHNLGVIGGTEWQFRYAPGTGTWQQLVGSTWVDRFLYTYGTGLWQDYGYTGTGWSNLSSDHLSSAFMGDGTSHDLGNGWWYAYLNTLGTWYTGDPASGGLGRFRYNYASGLWQDAGYGEEFYDLSSTGRSSAFMGDGTPHDLGNGWWFGYAASLGTWYTGDPAASGVGRFTYNYSSGLWQDAGYGGAFYDLSAAGRSSDFVGNGTPHDLGHGWWYGYSASLGTWYTGDPAASGLGRFTYNYGSGLWQDAGYGGAYYDLSAAGRSVAFVGDGTPHDLGNGWWYGYSASLGTWYTGDPAASGLGRFTYNYGSGLWRDAGYGGAFYDLSAAGRSSAFVGDGTPHDLGNGWWYGYAASLGTWYTGDPAGGGLGRFTYNYGSGLWQDAGYGGAFYDLSAIGRSSAFVGDGTPHDLGNGWWFGYAASLGTWYTGDPAASGVGRFTYNYGSGLWQDAGYGGVFYDLSGAGRSSDFVGNGTAHDLGNGWWYGYAASLGTWYTGDPAASGVGRFTYNYGSGLWQDAGYGGAFYDLSGTGRSSDFVGNGTPHDLGNGWWYGYAASLGTWYTGDPAASGVGRFTYNYGSGLWQDAGYNGVFYDLSAAGRSVAFVGDGTPRDLGNGWWYGYVASLGTWYTGDPGGSGVGRFAYNYGSGLWQDAGYGGAFYDLSGAGRSSDFVGNGTPHDLGNGWWYGYMASLGTWYTGDPAGGGLGRFTYNYGSGLWQHAGYNGVFYDLGSPGRSSSFMADGTPRDLGNGWWYGYAASLGTWYTGDPGGSGVGRFRYNYASGLWQDAGYGGAFYDLSSTGRSVAFVGDGTPHDLGNGWWYGYVAALGTWYTGDPAESGVSRFTYNYGSGLWQDAGYGGAFYDLSAAGRSSDFVGNGTAHDLGNGWWYGYAASLGTWYTGDPTASGVGRFRYNYSSGLWQDAGNDGVFYDLSASGRSANFLGNGTPHELGNGWWYGYAAALGTWYTGDPAASGVGRFTYNYGSGLWQDAGYDGAFYDLSAAGRSSDFVGNGTAHDLGNDWWYGYAALLGTWYTGDPTGGGIARFTYNYGSGLWQHADYNGVFYDLSAAGKSSAFMGGGTPRDMGNGWWYGYTAALGTWYTGDPTGGGLGRFRYNYASGLWQDAGYDGVFYDLSSTGRSVAFVGDGTPRDMGNGWWYGYAASLGTWYTGDPGAGGLGRFTYNYGSGLWQHAGYGGTFYDLSAAGTSSAFVGDGNLSGHDLGNGWLYAYDSSLAQGTWWNSPSQPAMFNYRYADGIWSDWCYYNGPAPPAGGWTQLSASGMSAAFVADGTPHYLGILGPGGLDWNYAYASGVGTWYDVAIDTKRFRYDYATGQWQDNRNDSSGDHWYYLGAWHQRSIFVGDGRTYSLSDGFAYTYLATGLSRSETCVLDGTHYFRYNYTSPGWEYSLNWGSTFYPWAQTTLVDDIWAGGSSDPAGLMVAEDGLLYFRASNADGYDLYRYNGALFTNVSGIGFDDFLRSTTVSGVGTYFTARLGSEWDVYKYDGTTFSLVSNTLENYSEIEYLATSTTGNVFYSVRNSGDSNWYLYTAYRDGSGDHWAQVSLEAGGFSRLDFATGNAGVDAFFYGRPAGGTTDYVYRVTSGGFTRIDNSYSLGDLVYAGRNSADLFFRGQDSGDSLYDIYRVWNNAGTWTFTNISNADFSFVDDATGRTLGDDVYFLGTTTTPSNHYDVFRWNATALEWQPVSTEAFDSVEWNNAKVTGGGVYFSAHSDSGWAVYRADGSSFSRISNYGIGDLKYAGTIGTTDYWTAQAKGVDSTYDLYSTSGTTFTKVTSGNFNTLQFQTQVGSSDLYFEAKSGATDSYDLYRFNGVNWTKLADTDYYSVQYMTRFPILNQQPERLIWRGQPSDGNSYYWFYSPTFGTSGQWSTAKASPSEFANLAAFNRDYYFSGTLGSDSDYELMRYWGDWDWVANRPVVP